MSTERSANTRVGRPYAAFDSARLDVTRFAEAEATLAGECQIADLPRLASSVVQPIDARSPPVRWSAAGDRARLAGAGPCPTLHLEVDAVVTLECQRCLEPLREALRVERRFFYVDGEDAAAALDLESEEDVLALQRSIDLRQLVEDELLLALPLIPRHATCPGGDSSTSVAAPDRSPSDSAVSAADHPFASLAALKRPARTN